jgi:hypothetical protein
LVWWRDEIDAAKECALTGSARADDANHLTLCNLKVHILEDYVITELFCHILDLQEGFGHGLLHQLLQDK